MIRTFASPNEEAPALAAIGKGPQPTPQEREQCRLVMELISPRHESLSSMINTCTFSLVEASMAFSIRYENEEAD
ncbi:hypothetical protein AAE478_008409 [Parahypoxylon ruwenzoriense]